MPDVTRDRVGALEREGPCQFCGRLVSQYEVVGEPRRSFFDHEHPWCEAYTALVAEQVRHVNPKEDDGESEN